MLSQKINNQSDKNHIKSECILEIQRCAELGVFTDDSISVKSACEYINSAKFNPIDSNEFFSKYVNTCAQIA